ncbi:MAG: hypothetical protein PHE70_08565 [Tepidanaerobacteraceae bacterium]|jgi:hypothetical protein|nr:hypothetical protein [Tepidanaerobacteraceae bacterium]
MRYDIVVVYNLLRPKRENKLPEVLDKEEVAKIFIGFSRKISSENF